MLYFSMVESKLKGYTIIRCLEGGFFMPGFKTLRMYISSAVARLLQPSQPKPAYKIYAEIMKKSAEEKNNQQGE